MHKNQKNSVLQSAEEVVEVLNRSALYLNEERDNEDMEYVFQHLTRLNENKKPQAFKYIVKVLSKAVYYNIPAQDESIPIRQIELITNYYNLQNVLQDDKTFKLKSTVFSDVTDHLFDVEADTGTDKIKKYTVSAPIVTRVPSPDSPDVFKTSMENVKKLSSKRNIINNKFKNKGSLGLCFKFKNIIFKY